MKITIVGAGRAGTSLFDALGAVGHDVDFDTTTSFVASRANSSPQRARRRHRIGLSRAVRLDDTVVAHVAGSRGPRSCRDTHRAPSCTPSPRYRLPGRSAASQRRPLQRGRRSTGRGGRRLTEWAVDSPLRRTARPLSRDGERHRESSGGPARSRPSVGRVGGLSLEDFLPLAQQALDDVNAMGVDAALTGPASRADMATIDAHLAAIPRSERSTYVALANAAFELAEKRRAHVRPSVLELPTSRSGAPSPSDQREAGLASASCRPWAPLHAGHVSLFRAAKEQSDVVLASTVRQSPSVRRRRRSRALPATPERRPRARPRVRRRLPGLADSPGHVARLPGSRRRPPCRWASSVSASRAPVDRDTSTG
jgi:hypothetical protein